MKSLLNRVVLLAAGAMVLGTMAFGQTQSQLEAQIPFAFHTAGGSFPAGQYTITRQTMMGGSFIATLRNQTSTHKVFVSGGVKDIWNAGSPAAVFRCTDDQGCVLTAIRTPDGSISYRSGKSASDKYGEKSKNATVMVPLRTVTAD